MGTNVRQSNMELLRLLAMFFILLLHANNTVFNYLTSADAVSRPLYVFPFMTVESFANVGVNVFVLISGWFGIRARLRGLSNVLFQPLFYSVFFLVLAIVIGFGDPLHPKCLANVFLFTKNYWYIKAYIGLYILSPVLNSFIEVGSKRQLLIVLCLFFIFEAVYGCTESAPDIYLGYSIISFIGLYLLGRYVRLYADKLKGYSVWTYLLIYIVSSIILAGLLHVSLMIDESGFIKRGLYAYCNPIVIIQSLSLLLLFNKFSFQSKLVNWAAVSCLSVYLIHENILLQNFYRSTANHIYTSNGFIVSFAELLFYIAAVFVLSIVVDQVRVLIWKRIENIVPNIAIDDYSK